MDVFIFSSATELVFWIDLPLCCVGGLSPAVSHGWTLNPGYSLVSVSFYSYVDSLEGPWTCCITLLYLELLVDPVTTDAVLFLSSQFAFYCGAALLLLLPDIKAETSGEEGLTTAARGILEELLLKSEETRKKVHPLCACSEEDVY